MDNKIPVTIITGFLGAGKTTLINELLYQPQDEKIAVIVNEYGDVGVDHHLVVNVEEEIYQMNNGCLCCTLRTDLSDMLQTIYSIREKQTVQIDRIIIETTGLAEPGPIAQTFMRHPFLQEHYTIDSVITLVDAGSALYQMAHYEESKNQVAFADKLLLTKVDSVSNETLYALKQKLRALNPFAAIDHLNLEEIAIKEVLGLELFNEQKREKVMTEVDEEEGHDHGDDHEGHHHHHDHHHTDDIVTLSLKAKEPIHPTLIDMWMNELIMTYGMDLLRYKGILHLYKDPNKIVYQGVNMTFQAERGQPWGDQEKESVLVFIGKNLPVKEMELAFKRCVLTEEVMEELGI